MFVKPRQVALSRFGTAGIAVCVLTFGVAQIGSTVSAAPHLQASDNDTQNDRPTPAITPLQGQPLTSQALQANDPKKLPVALPVAPVPITAPRAAAPTPSTTSTTAFAPLATQLFAQAIKNDIENADKARRAIAAATTPTTVTIPPTTVTTSPNPPAAATAQARPPTTVAPAAPATTLGMDAVPTPIPGPATAAAVAPATPSAPLAAASIQAKPFVPTRTPSATPGKPTSTNTRHHTLLTAQLAVGTGAGLLLIALATAVVIRNRRRHSENDPLDDSLQEVTPPTLTPETAAAATAPSVLLTVEPPLSTDVATPEPSTRVDMTDLTEFDMKTADDKVIEDLIAELNDVTSIYTNTALPLDPESTGEIAGSELDIEDEDEIGKHYAELDHAPVRFSFTISPG